MTDPGNIVCDNVWNRARISAWSGIQASVGSTVWDGVWDRVGSNVWDNVWIGVRIGMDGPRPRAATWSRTRDLLSQMER